MTAVVLTDGKDPLGPVVKDLLGPVVLTEGKDLLFPALRPSR
jgi:hypothetical protein